MSPPIPRSGRAPITPPVQTRVIGPLDRAADPFEESEHSGGPNDLADIVGPCCTAEGAAEILGVTESDVREQVANLRLIGATTADGATVLPTYQFINGRVRHELIELAGVFRGVDAACR
jgi:hypothetical protein